MKKTIIAVTALLAGSAQAGLFSEVEINNTLGMANNLGMFFEPGGSVIIDGAIDDNDVDWFSFTLNDTASLSVFAAFSLSSSGDGIMQIVSDGGDVLAFDDDSGLGAMPAIQLDSLNAGIYYVGLSGFGDVDSSSVDSDDLADGLGHQQSFAYKMTIGFTIIPAPGAAALLGLGGLVATRRRR